MFLKISEYMYTSVARIFNNQSSIFFLYLSLEHEEFNMAKINLY